MIDHVRSPRIRCLPLATICLTLALPALAGETRYGEGVDLEEPTPVADILADPDAWIGKTVRVEGGVLDVCPRKGCWIEIDDAGQSLRIKVEDDVIVFPADAKGRLATAQGTIEAVELSRESYLGWLAHLADEKGDEFDPETAEIGDGPFRIIQLRGTGAVLE